MKKTIILVLCLMLCVICVSCSSAADTSAPAISAGASIAVPEEADTIVTASETALPAAPDEAISDAADMTVSSTGISNGYISSAYGQNGDAVANGIPTLSLPLQISGAPDGTACFALSMADLDSEPLCGFSWVHWLAVNITETGIPENFSITSAGSIVQGTNDFGAVGYGGPTPPDKDHTYRITVYALDAPLPLKDGFTKDEFDAAVKGHVLAESIIDAVYKRLP